MKLLATLFALVTVLTLNAQQQQVNIAISTNELEFFEDYPVDTLVSHLNLLNKQSGVHYYKATANQKENPDYTIKLKLFIKKDDAYRVTTGTKSNSRAVMAAVTSPGGQVHYQLQNEFGSSETVVTPSLGPKLSFLLNLEVRNTEKNKRVRYKQFTIQGSEKEETDLIIMMIEEIQAFAERQHNRLAKS